ncbi:NAD(P)/FAD-dependent oxidoreductase [Roseibium litorale]|uniref:FAD-binding oxidoreductase n=1 Tax=Roseibium litorale TaxID=2803841 RepID=A0ABR9CP23_9HYPH|nr:FAD-binding oxidoreductase [Roseibium litorale]MBD8892628.1 FAD-binding oxidoreductase [Roseibium litorale]
MGVTGKTIIVVGAGMVGVSTALELLKRGAKVTLLDKNEPGRETSYGNAGVLARSSLMPINNPALLSQLPGLIGNQRTGLRYDPWFLASNLNWAMRFILSSRQSVFRKTTRALDSLIRLSIERHLRLLDETGMRERLSDHGWFFLYRDQKSFDRTALLRQTLDAHEVSVSELSAPELSQLEPALMPIFQHALWIKGSYSVNDPGAIVTGYARRFAELGGVFLQSAAERLFEDGTGAEVLLNSGERLQADKLVVCLGPWARNFLKKSGYDVMMAYERGYHMHFSGDTRSNEKRLTRPVYDTGGGYVLAPMTQGLRLTTGVELADCDAPRSDRQLKQAEKAAREAIYLGEQVEDEAWLGRRPTFPDSRPVIGLAPSSRNTYFAFGHQHIGFATGPGTALVLADLMEGNTPPIDAAPFKPERFISRIAG